MSITIKNPSPLVLAVVSLDNHLTEMIRLGSKIEETELKSNFDFEQVQKMITHFTECGEGVSQDVIRLSQSLKEVQAEAESKAALVAIKAELVQSRKETEEKKMEKFRLLGEKVRHVTTSLQDIKMDGVENLTTEDRLKVEMRLADFESQLAPLIEEAKSLRKEGQDSKIKSLEQGADSLAQSLTAARQKLKIFSQPQSPTQ